MIPEYLVTELWDLLWLYAGNAFTALTQKSIFVLIIQGVLKTLSFWDKNSRLFVILTAIGVYSVYGSLSVWVDLRRMELAAKRQREAKWKQYRLAINVRHRNLIYDEIIFIPEINNDEDYFGNLYNLEYTTNFEGNYNYV
ncbi:MAG: hypothetical protein K2N71_07165 [Oscillospiraceae bacterium]|nr:hypothetical protein [Oscillospiraceae bacterium]